MTLNYRIGTETDTTLKDATGLQHAVDAGFGWYRHMQINWSDWEPERKNPPEYIPPENDPTDNKAWRVELDDSIVRATAQGMKTIICVRHAPAWAVSSGVAGCGALKLSALVPFAQFMNYIIGKYKGGDYNVLHYELWNEPDMAVDTTDTSGERGCWYPLSTGPFRYTMMLQEVNAVIRTPHPEVFITNGGLSCSLGVRPEEINERKWVRRFLTGRDENGVQVGFVGAYEIDYLTYHAYDWTMESDPLWLGSSGSRPMEYQRKYDHLKSILGLVDTSASNLSYHIKGLWMNEGGLLAKGTEGPKLRLKQAYHIAYMLADMCTEGITKGPDKFFWFRLVEDPNKSYISSTLGEARGTYPNEYYLPRPHFAAFQFGLPFIEGANIIKWEETRANGKVKYIHFETGYSAGDEKALLINTNGASHTPFTYDFTDSTKGRAPYYVWDAFGNPVTLNGSSIYMDDPHRVLWIQWDVTPNP